jgi:hypothetical protein
MPRSWNVVFALALVPVIRVPAPVLSPGPVAAACWGDVNGDARVDVADAHGIARFAIGMRVTNSAAVVARGDVTGDGSVNVSDAQQVARHSVGLPAARRIAGRCS